MTDRLRSEPVSRRAGTSPEHGSAGGSLWPLMVPLLAFLLMGCGDRVSPDPPGAHSEGDLGTGNPADVAGGKGVEDSPGIPVVLTFIREEAPVQVTRRVAIHPVPIHPTPGIVQAEGVVRLALETLLQGPLPEERAAGITSFFGPGTEGLLRDVFLQGDTMVVDFGDFSATVPNAGSSTGSFYFLMELNGTVFAVPGVETVEYRMEGSCEAFWNFLQRGCQVVRRPESA